MRESTWREKLITVAISVLLFGGINCGPPGMTVKEVIDLDTASHITLSDGRTFVLLRNPLQPIPKGVILPGQRVSVTPKKPQQGTDHVWDLVPLDGPAQNSHLEAHLQVNGTNQPAVPPSPAPAPPTSDSPAQRTRTPVQRLTSSATPSPKNASTPTAQDTGFTQFFRDPDQQSEPAASGRSIGLVRSIDHGSQIGTLTLETSAGSQYFTLDAKTTYVGKLQEGEFAYVEFSDAADGTVRAKCVVDTDAEPVMMLMSYYAAIDSDNFQRAYSLRSNRSHSSTSFQTFLSTWETNQNIMLTQSETLNKTSVNARVALQLISVDIDPVTSQSHKTRHKGTVDLVWEDDGWRYDRADIKQVEEAK